MLRKLHRILAVVMAALFATAVAFITPSAAFADSSLIVTLGADLTDSQRETVLEFFNLTEDDLDNMEVIEVTNDDEREYLSNYLSDDVIGTTTMSCSYIEPTTSGGINVETANLTYVTKNTIANALETAGVENVNIVVTAPYEVSGTGALTGVFMAYEAIGEELDEDAQEAAAEELVESAELEDEYGEDITDVISDIKNEVSSDSSLTDDDILDLVQQAAEDKGLSLDDDALQTIADIASRAQSVGFGTESTGFWNSIKSFFTNIGTAISNWVSDIVETVTGNSSDDSDDDADSDSTDSENEDNDSSDEGILGTLNTDIFDLDDPSSDDTDDEETDSDESDSDTDNTDSSSTDDSSADSSTSSTDGTSSDSESTSDTDTTY